MVMGEALHSPFRGIALGLGAMSADLIYYYLLSHGIEAWHDHWLARFAMGVGLFYLLVIAWRMVRHGSTTQSLYHQRGGWWHLYGRALAITLFFPYTFLFWSGMAL